MPWRGPEYDGEFPSLGWATVEWIERYFTAPDGPFAGQPLVLTDEQTTFTVRWYMLGDDGRFTFRRGALRRAQGHGKSPILGALALAELCGPVVFDGWNADGEPVGRPPLTPLVQIAAVSEDQAGNTYSAVYAMASESELSETVLDVGLTRVGLRNATGRLEPVTAAAGTRLGQRLSAAFLDEPHLWTKRNGGVKLASTMRRNAAKMDGRTLESTNAHAPGEDSVAEQTYRASLNGAPGLLYDSLEGPEVKDLSDREAVKASLKVAYGDARWVDLGRIADEIADPATDPSDARRFYLNQIVSDASRPVDILRWEQLAAPETAVQPGAHIGLGFDGSISDDSTVLYGCTAEGHIFELAAWERPLDAPHDWRVPRKEVNDAVDSAFETYRVGRMLADPPKWWSEIEGWAERFGEEVVIALDTNQAKRFAPVCGRFATAVREGSCSHDGRPGLTLNLAACAKKKVRINDDEEDGRTQFVIVKADTRKIDRAVGGFLALEAAMTMPVRGTPQVVNLSDVHAEMVKAGEL